MSINDKTGPFAVVDRINLFEDENGLHVSIVNPTNINRIINKILTGADSACILNRLNL